MKIMKYRLLAWAFPTDDDCAAHGLVSELQQKLQRIDVSKSVWSVALMRL
jgi:hypothetical protein